MHGADVELPDNYGQSPLFMACWKGRSSSIFTNIHLSYFEKKKKMCTVTDVINKKLVLSYMLLLVQVTGMLQNFSLKMLRTETAEQKQASRPYFRYHRSLVLVLSAKILVREGYQFGSRSKIK